jgi:hypothetical protein
MYIGFGGVAGSLNCKGSINTLSNPTMSLSAYYASIKLVGT